MLLREDHLSGRQKVLTSWVSFVSWPAGLNWSNQGLPYHLRRVFLATKMHLSVPNCESYPPTFDPRVASKRGVFGPFLPKGIHTQYIFAGHGSRQLPQHFRQCPKSLPFKHQPFRVSRVLSPSTRMANKVSSTPPEAVAGP